MADAIERGVPEREERDDTEHVLQERHRPALDPRQRHAAQLGIHLALGRLFLFLLSRDIG